MRAAMIRAGSFAGSSPAAPDSPRCCLARRGLVPCFLTGDCNVRSPTKSLQFEISKSDCASENEFFAGSLKRNGMQARLPEEKNIEKIPKIGVAMDEKRRSEHSDRSRIKDYYREMVRLNPRDSLLLRNYGAYLHEVEKDSAGAAEYYGRAILNSPEDGELLCLYGNLVWESERDESRAISYMDRAILASPNDCMILGSYARLMWEAEEDEEV